MPMVFRITQLPVGEDIGFDALPTAKITQYPLEKGPYKPYAQASVSVSAEALAIRMMAFEAITTPQSKLLAVMYPYQDQPDTVLFVQSTSEKQNGTSVWLKKGEEILYLATQAQHREGEDLQGIYWGWDVLIPRSELEQHGEVYTNPGDRFPGNFYKIQSTEPSHYGSFAPVAPENVGENAAFGKNNMGTFEIISY